MVRNVLILIHLIRTTADMRESSQGACSAARPPRTPVWARTQAFPFSSVYYCTSRTTYQKRSSAHSNRKRREGGLDGRCPDPRITTSLFSARQDDVKLVTYMGAFKPHPSGQNGKICEAREIAGGVAPTEMDTVRDTWWHSIGMMLNSVCGRPGSCNNIIIYQ